MMVFNPRKIMLARGTLTVRGITEACAIAGIIVMNAMNEEMRFFPHADEGV
jgi:hypothetical protein